MLRPLRPPQDTVLDDVSRETQELFGTREVCVAEVGAGPWGPWGLVTKNTHSFSVNPDHRHYDIITSSFFCRKKHACHTCAAHVSCYEALWIKTLQLLSFFKKVNRHFCTIDSIYCFRILHVRIGCLKGSSIFLLTNIPTLLLRG